MNAIALRAAAALVTAATFVGSTGYVVTHPKNPDAPLQPPAAEAVVPPSPTPAPTGHGSSERQTPRPTPRITLQPAVRATQLPGVTYTHVS